MRKARACFCASSICALCGLLIATAGLSILISMSIDKKNTNDEDADLWIVLTMVILSGILLAMVGFCCGHCTICCCNGDGRVAADDLEGLDGDGKGWADD